MGRSIFTDEDKGDTQALLKTGFDDLWCNYLMLRIVEPKPARQWLRGQLVEIKSYSQIGRAQHATHVRQMALTAAGLGKLGLDPALIAQFAPEFTIGLADDPSRSRRLGDIGRNDPAKWMWGTGAKEPHVVLMVFDEDDARLKSVTDQILAEAKASGLSEVITLDSGDMGDREPFGFRDGLSQPAIDWHGERTPGDAADMDFHNLITLGEFLLGYRNEYGLYTERPLLEPQAPGANSLPVAEDQPELRDLGRNGSYLVFRQLDQDVRRFWSWMREAAGEADAVRLAEAMVGRLYDTGGPFAQLGTLDIRGIKDRAINGFNFRSDPHGRICPIGAHIRRSNPRTGDYPTGRTGIIKKLLTLSGLTGTPEEDRIASTRFHRILRRGREYGEPLDRLEAVKPGAKDPRSGLHFICLNANLSRQFEFVQGAWLANAKFAGMSNEQDPLLGNREPFPGTQVNDRFTRPHADGPCRVSNAVPQFIAVRGGAYFFLPGLRALNWLLADR
jgi:deferrochelatase/peroxidase EfeB